MKVKIYSGIAPNIKGLDDRGYIDIEPGMTVKQVLKKVGCSPIIWRLGLFHVNHKKERVNKVLAEGDIISIYTPAVGG